MQGGPIVIVPNERDARWWARRRPWWNVFSFSHSLTGMRSDRVVVQRPQFFVDPLDEAMFIRVYDHARTKVRFPGRLLLVDWQGLPISILRHR